MYLLENLKHLRISTRTAYIANMAVLLLDFDGVILRNHSIHGHVSSRCNSFTQRYIPIRNPIKMRQINNEMYESYGHTVIGLRALGFDADINEFNHYVYDRIDMGSLRDVKTTHKRDIQQTKEMLAHVKHKEIEVRLLTNAPDVWCQTILSMMGVDPIEKISTLGMLKPENSCFNHVEQLFPMDQKFIFVDDKIINLRGVMTRPHWQRVLFMGADTTDVTHYELPNISVVNKMSFLTRTHAFNVSKI